MIIYLCGCFFGIIVALLVPNRIEILHDNAYKYRVYFAFLSSLPFLLIAVLRYDVGADYITYENIYYSILKTGTASYAEIGFIKLNQLLGYLGFDSMSLFMVCGILFCFLIFTTIYKLSEYPWISIAFLFIGCFYFASLNGIRQWVAAAFVFYSTRYILKQEFIKFILCILLAQIFHVTSLLCIILYFLPKIKLSKRHFFINIIIIICIFIGLSFIFKQTIYFTKYVYFFDEYASNISVQDLILRPILFLISTYYFIRTDNYKFNFFYNIQLISLFLCIFSIIVPIGMMTSRILFYFTIYEILIIPNLLFLEKNKINKIFLFLFLFLLYSSYFYIFIVLNGGHSVLPYKTIFENL